METRKVRSGKYIVTREDDGRKFTIFQGYSKIWIILANDTGSLDDAKTLSAAKMGLQHRWTLQSRETVS